MCVVGLTLKETKPSEQEITIFFVNFVLVHLEEHNIL